MKIVCFFVVASTMLLSTPFLFASGLAKTSPEVTYTFGLPAQDLRHVMQDRFQISGHANAIPAAVLKEMVAHDFRLMKTLPGYQGLSIPEPDTYPLLVMADAGKRFNDTDCIDPSLPGEQLTFVGVTPDYCVLSWKTGGWISHLMMAVFRLSKTASGKDQATLIGAALPNHTVKNMEELRKKAASGGYEAFDYTRYLLL